MEIVYRSIDTIYPYERNPRNNDNAVAAVAASIREFGWKVPVVIDSEGVIVAGHTRYRAAQELGLEEIPCIVADDLSPQQIKAYRLADNKTSELAFWDMPLLDAEMAELDMDMEQFGFADVSDVDWDDGSEELSDEEYDEPEHVMLECPNCHHTDRKDRFKKV